MDQERVKTFLFKDDGKIPNNPDLPLIIYPQAFLDRLADYEQVVHANNWTNSWKGGVFDYHHFHSNTHEVLVIDSGTATIQFGGEKGKEISVAAGDAVIIPAGVGHKKLQASPDFQVMGAYPDGKEHDLLTGKPEEREKALENIKNVSVPAKDPVFAESGPMQEIWMGF